MVHNQLCITIIIIITFITIIITITLQPHYNTVVYSTNSVITRLRLGYSVITLITV